MKTAPVKRIDISISQWWKQVKDEPIEEIKKRFSERYLALYEELQKVTDHWVEHGNEIIEKELDERRRSLRAEEIRLNNRIVSFESQEKILRKAETLMDKFKKACEPINKNIREWLFSPNCNNPEFQRGYYACYAEMMRLMDEDDLFGLIKKRRKDSKKGRLIDGTHYDDVPFG